MNERLESETLEPARPTAVVVGAKRRKELRCETREGIPQRFLRDDPANGIFLCAGAFLLSLVLPDRRQDIDEAIPGPKERPFQQIPAFTRPRVCEFLLDRQAQLPDDFKPAVAVIESPAHAGLRHRGVVVLIEDGKAREELSREFRIHGGPKVVNFSSPVVYVE